MKTLFNLIICFLLSLTGVSQTSSIIDSIKLELKNPKTQDSEKVSAFLTLAKKYMSIDLDSSAYYANRSVEASLKQNKYQIVKAYNSLGLIHFYNSRSDSARYYYDKALKILDINDNDIQRSTIYCNYSLSYQNTGEFQKRLDYSQKAIDLVENNPVEVCLLYFNHSILFAEGGFNEKSKKYLKLALENSITAKDYRVEGAVLRQLAYHSVDEKEFESAKIYLNRGLELCEKLKSAETCFEVNIMLGELYDELEEYDKAEEVLLKAKFFAISRKIKYQIMASNILLGKHELKKGDYRKSSDYFEEFGQMYANNPEPQIGIEGFSNWADVEIKQKNYKKSIELLEKYHVLQDSVYSEENRSIIANVEAKYENEKKEKEIIVQKLQLRENENELQTKRSQSNYMIGIIVFLLVASILTWFLYQQKEKQKNQEILTLKREVQIKTLESLIEGEEKERFRIAKELHDGVNGDLSAIKYKLSSLLEMNNKVIKEAITMIDDSCKQVRAISHNLVPPSLEKFNLVEAAEEYCNNLNEINTDVEFTFQHLGDALDVSKKAEVNVFRIIQELITNSIKHADASSINVQISCYNNSVQLSIEDDGKGFDKDKVESGGIGLSNVQSRIDYLQATVDFISNKNGTSYTIDIDKEKLNDN